MVTFRGILAQVLQGHGFEVYERDDILFGEREGVLVCVGIYNMCEVRHISAYLENVKDMKGSRVIACARPVTPEIEDMATANNISIWHLEDIEREIGNALINHMGTAVDSATPFFSEIIRSQVLEKPEMEPEVSTERKMPVVIDSLGTGDSENFQTPTIELDDVKEISRNTVKGFKFELELVPHYLFEYYCRFEGKGGAERKNTGLIQINAFTGFPVTLDEELEFSDRIEIPHVKIEPKIDENDALATAVAKVIELNTEHDDLILEKEHATVTERTTFKPTEDDITITKKGLVHVPVWCVEGTHGVMIINAASGKVLSEEYYDEKDGY